MSSCVMLPRTAVPLCNSVRRLRGWQSACLCVRSARIPFASTLRLLRSPNKTGTGSRISPLEAAISDLARVPVPVLLGPFIRLVEQTAPSRSDEESRPLDRSRVLRRKRYGYRRRSVTLRTFRRAEHDRPIFMRCQAKPGLPTIDPPCVARVACPPVLFSRLAGRAARASICLRRNGQQT
jgi:hypothetical protein